MGDMSKEPSMEDILSSIRRVIEREDSERDSGGASPQPVQFDEEPLELTEVSELPPVSSDNARAPVPAPIDDDDSIVSSSTADASRSKLASLQTLSDSETGRAASPTIEDMVRESLRPMLKSWLDENLPAVVERIVQREVERITRK